MWRRYFHHRSAPLRRKGSYRLSSLRHPRPSHRSGRRCPSRHLPRLWSERPRGLSRPVLLSAGTAPLSRRPRRRSRSNRTPVSRSPRQSVAGLCRPDTGNLLLVKASFISPPTGLSSSDQLGSTVLAGRSPSGPYDVLSAAMGAGNRFVLLFLGNFVKGCQHDALVRRIKTDVF